MRALPAMKLTQHTHDLPHCDFTGRKLRLVSKQLAQINEASPLHEAIAKYLEALP